MNTQKNNALKFILIFCFFSLLITLLNCCATSNNKNDNDNLLKLKPFKFENRYITAILPFQYKGEQKKYSDLSNKIVDLAIVDLFNTKRFRVVERSRIDALLNEKKLSQLGITSNKIANEIGQKVGAQLVLVGTLSSIKPIDEKDSVGLAWQQSHGFEVSLQARLIDVVKGEIIAVGQAKGIQLETERMALGAKTGTIAPDETLINKALEKAVKKLVFDFASQISPKSSN